MLTFISFAFKIVFAVILTLVLVYFSSRNKTDINKNKKLIIYSLSIVSILSILYNISLVSTGIYYSFGILSSTIILLFFIYKNSNESKDYFIIYSLIILISLGYILSSLLLFIVFILLDNYFVNIEEYFNSDSIDFDDQIEVKENKE